MVRAEAPRRTSGASDISVNGISPCVTCPPVSADGTHYGPGGQSVSEGAGAWQPAPARPVISSGALELYGFALDVPAAVVARVRRVLAPDELSRALRFHFPRDAARYIAGRGALRI